MTPAERAAIAARDAAWTPRCVDDDSWGDPCDLPEALHIPDGPDAPEWVACEKRRPDHPFQFPTTSPAADRRVLLAALTEAESEVERLRAVIVTVAQWDQWVGEWLAKHPEGTR